MDTLRRFMLERTQVRGGWVHLDQSWQTMLQRSDYPAFVQAVLGEALSAAVLLSATIKHSGSLILQIRGDGPIHLLVVQATPQGEVRGLAQWNRNAAGTHLCDLFGNAQIAITVEAPNNSERYQSLIPMEGDSLAQALEAYFARSEQLPTRLWLTANARSAAGLLLQRLPRELAHEEDWQRASCLLDTLTHEELQELDAEAVIYRLFHEEEPRLFDPTPIQFHCDCSRTRAERAVLSLGQAEAEALVKERGKIQITCEFCNTNYTLDAIDVRQLFYPSMPSNSTLH